jgi:hypothetical protein
LKSKAKLKNMHAIYPKQLIPEFATDPTNPAVGEPWIRTTVFDPAGSLQTTGLMGLLLNDDPLGNATVKINTSFGVINLGTII